MNQWLKRAALLFWILGICTKEAPVWAADMPQGWPWRGIAVTSASSPDEKDIEYLSSIHVNSIELQLDTRLVAQRYSLPPDEALLRDMQWADRMLDACKKYGITGILSISQIPIDPKAGITQESTGFWDTEKRIEAVRIAGILARHFRNRGAELGAYEILNEPVVWRGRNAAMPESWRELMKSAINEIRKHDPGRFIVVTPVLGGMPDQYNENVKPLDDARIIYGLHMYLPHDYTHQGIQGRPLGLKYPGLVSFQYYDKNKLEQLMMPAILFQRKYKVPLWVGEFSSARWAEGSNEYLRDLIDIFDKHGLGWAYFQYKSYHGWDPDNNMIYCTDDQIGSSRIYQGRGSSRWQLLKRAFDKNRAVRSGKR